MTKGTTLEAIVNGAFSIMTRQPLKVLQQELDRTPYDQRAAIDPDSRQAW